MHVGRLERASQPTLRFTCCCGQVATWKTTSDSTAISARSTYLRGRNRAGVRRKKRAWGSREALLAGMVRSPGSGSKKPLRLPLHAVPEQGGAHVAITSCWVGTT